MLPPGFPLRPAQQQPGSCRAAAPSRGEAKSADDADDHTDTDAYGTTGEDTASISAGGDEPEASCAGQQLHSSEAAATSHSNGGLASSSTNTVATTAMNAATMTTSATGQPQPTEDLEGTNRDSRDGAVASHTAADAAEGSLPPPLPTSFHTKAGEEPSSTREAADVASQSVAATNVCSTECTDVTITSDSEDVAAGSQ